VEGVIISGGEPTLQSELIDLIDLLNMRGIKFVGIDSNGSRPEIIKSLVNKVHRFAIDFKVPWENYDYVSPSRNFSIAVEQTISFLSHTFTGNFEVRTTVTRQFHSSEGLMKMGYTLQNLGFYGIWVLQEYQFSKGVNPSMKHCFAAWSRDELYAIGYRLMKECGVKVALRTATRGFEKVVI